MGYLIYGLSTTGWMVIIGRFFVGASCAMTISVVMSYYVCSTNEYNVLCEKVGKPKKLRLKRQLTVIYSFVGSSSSIPVLGKIYVTGFAKTRLMG